MIKTAQDLKVVTRMLIEEMNALVDQAMEVAVYVFRYPISGLRIVHYTHKPVRELYIYDTLLFIVEIKANTFDPNKADFYFGGEIQEFVNFSGSPLVAITKEGGIII